jgi:hypothetical protein
MTVPSDPNKVSIVIEELKVLYDAERERDEVRFAELYAQHTAAGEDRRRRAAESEARARSERAVHQARGSWA